jgi:hypothetical protein
MTGKRPTPLPHVATLRSSAQPRLKALCAMYTPCSPRTRRADCRWCYVALDCESGCELWRVSHAELCNYVRTNRHCKTVCLTYRTRAAAHTHTLGRAQAHHVCTHAVDRCARNVAWPCPKTGRLK